MSSSSTAQFDPLDTHPPLPARAVKGKGAQGGAAGKNRKNAQNGSGAARAPKSVTIKGFGGVPGNNNNNNNNNSISNNQNHKSASSGVNNNNNAKSANNKNVAAPPASSAPTSMYASPAGIFIAPAHALPSMMAGRFAATAATYPPNASAPADHSEGKLKVYFNNVREIW